MSIIILAPQIFVLVPEPRAELIGRSPRREYTIIPHGYLHRGKG
jgi:hypothetical protein